MKSLILLILLFLIGVACVSKEEECLTKEECLVMHTTTTVDLPKEEETVLDEKPVICSIGNGNYFIDDYLDSIAFSALDDSILAAMTRRETDMVTLVVDMNTPFFYVSQMMTMAHENKWRLLFKD